MSNLYDFNLEGLGETDVSLSDYKGKVVLIVNVASACGLTPQYTKLEEQYQKYKDQGLVVLGVPCNQFGAQEPGSDEEIQTFCSTNYKVTFPMSGKVEVNGDGRHPLYNWLAGDDAKFPGDLSWNFGKFLISKEGDVAARFDPKVEPDDATVTSAIEAAL